jgi:hypothetical protein
MPTENMQVAASSDDAEQGDTTMLLTGAYIRWYQGSACHGGFRFAPGSQIPQGSTITSATFSYKYTHADYDTLSASVWAEDGANPGTFTTGASDISNRTATTATGSIADTDVGVDWQTLDVASIIQELADDYDIDAIVIVAYDASSDTARWITYDGDTANCPKLDIEYTAPSGGAAVQMIDHKRRRV